MKLVFSKSKMFAVKVPKQKEEQGCLYKFIQKKMFVQCKVMNFTGQNILSLQCNYIVFMQVGFFDENSY